MGYETYWSGELKIEPPLPFDLQPREDWRPGFASLLADAGLDFLRELGERCEMDGGLELKYEQGSVSPRSLCFRSGWGRWYDAEMQEQLQRFVSYAAERGSTVTGELFAEAEIDGYSYWKLVVVDGRVTQVDSEVVYEDDPRLLSNAELATVLAALRNWQLRPAAWVAFASHFEEHEPLSAEEIDNLCERLNVAAHPETRR